MVIPYAKEVGNKIGRIEMEELTGEKRDPKLFLF
jgi:hypothetical protein